METAAQIVLGAGATTFFHPVAYAKVLIQLGYEPIPPKLSSNIFGSKVLMYPNIFKYIGHIKDRDGFFGLYRGLSYRLLSTLVKSCTSAKVYAALTEPVAPEISRANNSSSVADDSCVVHEDNLAKLFKDTMNEALSSCAGVIISQPFHVIFIRSVSLFVGGESQYSSLLSSLHDIWTAEGMSGLFAGLVPRLLGEVLTIVLSNILTYVINNLILNTKSSQDKELSGYSGTISNLVVSQMTYPFTVVANIMAVNGCRGLVIGSAYDYRGWISCWASLASQNELKRGSSMFWRQYRGPVSVERDGTLIPGPRRVFA